MPHSGPAEAPRAAPQTAVPKTAAAGPPPQAPAAQPASGARQLFTLQALSAYAGMVIDSGNTGSGGQPDAGATAQGAGSGRVAGQAGETRPPPPGSMLDLKV